ncbi:glucose-1-phosphate adenylyltransferase [Paenibacillus abyssi]|uniref:Glucose-1-phosphate adenylyltransferase n=1 Tax=Paenibacillus abyssi TaxID=1340531 RepID=A0A917FWX1_9BACL|nr:glucose-1-phosphate adenylyltransferase [Paenibacillus abyssi]GGG09032.1 glucose-1-phosphate adenylyltransferase [Paenibacillus abyssi]
MRPNECVAMVLAGGEGKRLAPLTSKVAKPAVPFGGSYRIVDFPLSNCKNSGIHSIGVLTQYMSESLETHIQDGKAWTDNEADSEKVTLLPSSELGTKGYCGTADAIYQNRDFIDRLNPEHVLILSGDHIYQMDYQAMLDFHKSRGAEATISVNRVPWKEASRFGIMNTDPEMRVIEFVEKPDKPVSNLASMGVYLFRWSFLKAYLEEDAKNSKSSHDFGKDIIPRILQTCSNIYACPFDGYWRDVGTVESLWEAHMDLLDGQISLERPEWPMYTSDNDTRFASYCSPFADISQSLMHHRCAVEGDLNRSVLFSNVQVGRGSEINESIIMPNVKIGRNVKITRAIIGEGTIIEDGAVIGGGQEITVIGADEIVFSSTSLADKPKQLLKGIYNKSMQIPVNS